ncbi:MAG: hypothetical protein AAB768_00090, partial [Patescibacteria group bacterium]
NLPLEKPILIIYFSRECEECQALTKDIISHKCVVKGLCSNDNLSAGRDSQTICKFQFNYIPPFQLKNISLDKDKKKIVVCC